MKQLFIIIIVLFSVNVFAQNVGIGTTAPTDQLHTTGAVRLQKYGGPTTRLLQIDSAGRLVATSAGAIFSNVSPFAISDNGCATGVGITSTITVTGMPTAIISSKIAVRVNITHPFVGDLKIYLFPPTGNVLTLADNNGGAGNDFTNTIFTDLATSSISTGVAPFTGHYKPMGVVAGCNIATPAISNFFTIGFGSVVPNGNWTLKVFDASGSDIGTLNSWSISFSGPESITTADENNFIPKLVGGNFIASNIFQPAGSTNIGIGTQTPSDPLTVQTASGVAGITHTDGTVALKTIVNSSGGFFGTTTNHPFYLLSNGSTKVTILSNGNVGIGNVTPTTAGLVVNKVVGNTNAVFGSATTGVSIQTNYPGIGFNTYYNAGSFNIASGGAGYIGVDPSNSKIILSNSGGIAAANAATALQDKMWIEYDGTVSMGSSNLNAENNTLGSGYKLKVFGKIISEEVRVQLKTAWPDYVFEKNYKKLSLTELEKFLEKNKHLPNIPSAKEIETDGQHLGEIQRKMLEKIEELSLYVIELKKEIDILKIKN